MDLNRHHRPDPSTAERLLTGRLGADDAPPGYRRVASLLDDAAGGFAEPEGTQAAATASGMVEHISTAPVPRASVRRRPMLAKLLAAKTIAAVGFVALTASGAAAATGNLPDSVQGKVARAAKHVGLNLPGVDRKTEGCPAGVDASEFRNRGQYLKWVREHQPQNLEAARRSACGMPVNSKGTPGVDEESGTEAPESGAPKAPKAPKEPKNNGAAGQENGQVPADPGPPATAGAPPPGAPPAETPPAPTPPVEIPEIDHPTGDDHPTAENNPGRPS